MVVAEMMVTSYTVAADELVESKSIRDVEISIKLDTKMDAWLSIDGGHCSMRLANVPKAIARGGWHAQVGTPLVHIPGEGWGGRNFPDYFIEAKELEQAYRELLGRAAHPTKGRNRLEAHVIFIEWAKHEDGFIFASPPIGPFRSTTAANKAATKIRKRLRKNGHPFRRVKTSILKDPETIWGWTAFQAKD